MSAPLHPQDVEISDGLTLADLATVEDCQMAILTLARDINRIEEQLADGPATGEWAERAESAVRFKKALRHVVTERIGAIKRAERLALVATRERVLIERMKADWPKQFQSALAAAQAAHPELWETS
jgi:hypothetical protein